MKFSWKQMLVKGLKYLALYGLPFVIAQAFQFYPEVMALSVGTILTMLMNFLKIKVGLRLP